MGRQLISYMVSSGLVALAEAVPNAMGGVFSERVLDDGAW